MDFDEGVVPEVRRLHAHLLLHARVVFRARLAAFREPQLVVGLLQAHRVPRQLGRARLLHLEILIGPIEKGKRFNVSEMRKNCSVVVIMNQLAITWYAGANVGVFVVCFLLIAEHIAHDTPDTGMLTNSEVLIYPWYGIAI